MHAGRRLARALAMASRWSPSSPSCRLQGERSLRNLPRWYSTALNLHKDSPDNNPNIPWDFTPANMARKLQQTYSVHQKLISKSDGVLFSAGDLRNSGLASISASHISWRTSFTRGYRSSSQSRKHENRVSDEVQDDRKGRDDSYEVLDEQQIENEDDNDYEVLDEQHIEDDDDDEEEEEQEEGSETYAPVTKKSLFQPPKPKVAEEGPILNEKITARTLRLVDDDNKSHRIVSREEALFLAKRKELDLVQVDGGADPPVCKIFNFHREQYRREQIKKERRKQKGAATKLSEVKELRFNAKTEPKDLKMKVEKAKKFMDRGYRVKFVANFKANIEDAAVRQENAKLLDSLYPMMDDIAVIEQGPRVESRQAWVIVRHMKFGKVKKKSASPPKMVETSAQVHNLQEEHLVSAR